MDTVFGYYLGCNGVILPESEFYLCITLQAFKVTIYKWNSRGMNLNLIMIHSFQNMLNQTLLPEDISFHPLVMKLFQILFFCVGWGLLSKYIDTSHPGLVFRCLHRICLTHSLFMVQVRYVFFLDIYIGFGIGVAVNTCRNEDKILTVKSFYIELHTQYIKVSVELLLYRKIQVDLSIRITCTVLQLSVVGSL